MLVHGHAGPDVTAALDGLSVLRALKTNEFDVALPDISGVDIVSRSRVEQGVTRGPTFIAIMGDECGLLRDPDNRDIFGRVVTKLLDIDPICALVEQPVLQAEPVRCDKRRYNRRNRIKIMFGGLKDWRGVATRYYR